MIRVGLPMSVVEELADRSQRFACRIATAPERAVASMKTAVQAMTVKARAAHVQRATERAAAMLPDIEKQFDDLVDVLCWSAKDGDHTGRDEKYANVRGWFLCQYRDIRPAIVARLSTQPHDRVRIEPRRRAPRDAFESLFLPSSVSVNINSDTVICRITRSRDALEQLRIDIERDARR